MLRLDQVGVSLSVVLPRSVLLLQMNLKVRTVLIGADRQATPKLMELMLRRVLELFSSDVRVKAPRLQLLVIRMIWLLLLYG